MMVLNISGQLINVSGYCKAQGRMHLNIKCYRKMIVEDY